MGFTVETTLQGLFVVTEKSIKRFDQTGESESQGLLVRAQYDNVYKTLWVANVLKAGEVFESGASYSPEHGVSQPKQTPKLAVCLQALEHLLSRTTSGEYDAVIDILNQEKKSPAELDRHKYWGEIQDIYWHVEELREGKYHESDSVKYTGRRGIPRISTIGRRLVDEIMDLFWKMDSNLPNMWNPNIHGAYHNYAE